MFKKNVGRVQID